MACRWSDRVTQEPATTVVPVLLAGGSGTRLWPVSRKSFPKQFASLIEDETLFQASARRLAGPGYAPPLVLTHEDFRFIVTEQLGDIGVTPAAVMIEPVGRNTAPAVLAAALHVAAEDPDALLLVAPSDHAIADTRAFRRAVETGIPLAQTGRIVTFGIQPTRPETGYGYLQVSGSPDQASAHLVRFVEKPDAATAQQMLASGDFLWNAGIFLFSARTMIEAFGRHAPDYLRPVQQALDEAQQDLGFLRIGSAAWKALQDQSIDYAVMEKADNLSVVRFSGQWSDLGGWDSIWREAQGSGPAPRGAVTDLRFDSDRL